ncbi:MAG: TolC family protein [Phormidesmis sp.]
MIAVDFSADALAQPDNTLMELLDDAGSLPDSSEAVTAISLEQVIQIAEQSNRDIEQARIAVQQAQGAVEEQTASYQPTVGVSAAGDYDLPLTSDYDDDATLSGGVDVSYTLLDFGRREAALDISNAELRVAELELQQVQQTIKLDVATLYYDLQNAIENVRINQAAVANSEQNLRDTEIREQAGAGTRYDTLQARTQLADDRVNLLSAQNDQAIAEKSLIQILGIGETVESLPIAPIARRSAWPLGLDETLAQAYEIRSELAQQQLEQSIQQNTARLAWAELSPEVSVSAGYDFQNSLIDTLDTFNSWQDGLNMSLDMEWTLYDGGVARAQASQAESSEAIALSELNNQRDQNRLEVQTAYLTLQSETEQITAAGLGVSSAEEGLRLARLRFQAGVGTQLEVLEAQSDLTDAESSLAQAITAYNQATVELERSVSGL